MPCGGKGATVTAVHRSMGSGLLWRPGSDQCPSVLWAPESIPCLPLVTHGQLAGAMGSSRQHHQLNRSQLWQCLVLRPILP